MPRAPSDNSKKAEQLYLEGKKLTEIAQMLGVPDGTVRRWKHDHKWDRKPSGSKNEKSERSETKANVRKRGGQKGNHNTLKHGGYSKIFWDTLDADELEMVMNMPEDEEEMLLDEIRIYTARERRILKAINWYREKKKEEPLTIASVSRQEEKRQFRNDDEKQEYEDRVSEKVERGDRMPGTRYNLITNTEPKDSAIARLEKELSVVQGKKAQAIQILVDLRMERQKLAGDSKKDDIVEAWITGLMGGE